VTNTFATREQWLHAFADKARPHFASHGVYIASNIRISIGFPTKGYRSNTAGECIFPGASADGHYEIFINPRLTGDSRLADVLTHELIHASNGGIHGHKRDFATPAKALGLTGKMTATVASPKWDAWALPIIDELGPMPFAQIDGLTGPAKKKQTFQHKVECPDCGWLARVNATHCYPDMTCPLPDCGGELIVHPLKQAS
jgi:hypothetical protein